MKEVAKQKLNNKKPNFALKRLIKFLIIILIVVASYFISAYVSGHTETIIKIIKLVFYSACGFVGFYVLYFIAKLITNLVYTSKRKKQASVIISCDDDVALLMSTTEYKFNYSTKLTFKENANVYKDKILSLVKAVASGYNEKVGEYYYLDYTLYDALSVLSNLIDGIDYKVTPIFKFLRAEDKPLRIVEKLLIKAIESPENVEEVEDKKKKSKAMEFITNSLKKTGVFLIKGVIDNACNDLSTFVAFEAFKVYGKDGKPYLPTEKEEAK